MLPHLPPSPHTHTHKTKKERKKERKKGEENKREVKLKLLTIILFFFFFVELENRLLSRFDAASQRRELSTMAECAKILSQVIASYGYNQLSFWSLH